MYKCCFILTECSANCTNGVCDQTAGACESCVDGSWGVNCSESKLLNIMVTKVTIDCNMLQVKTLNMQGICVIFCHVNLLLVLSPPRWQCSIYVTGCPTNCEPGICDKAVGACSGCIKGYWGPMCQQSQLLQYTALPFIQI